MGIRTVLFLLIFLGCCVAPASALLLNYTVDSTMPVGIKGTYAFQGGQGHAMIKNSSGTIYVTYMTQESGTYINKLAWSSDGGITWTNATTIAVNGVTSYASLYMPDIAIDSSDTIHMVYTTDIGFLEYVNYSLSGGFGDIFVLNDTTTTSHNRPSISIDSQNVAHVLFISNEGLLYTNISPLTGIGPPHFITSNHGIPIAEVDANDIVHIVYNADDGAGQYQFRYLNFSSSGWGNILNMSDSVVPSSRVLDVTIDTNKIHILYVDSSANTRVVNTSASTNFKASNPVTIQTGSFTGATMAEDSEGTLHFISMFGTQMRYYNFTSSGVSSMKTLSPSGSGRSGPRMLWSINPPGNIPSAGFEMIYSQTGISVNYSVLSPDPGVPVPSEISVWLDSNRATSFLAGTMEMGMIVFVLGATVAVVIAYLRR
jgi:hypothetical protein